MGLRNAPFEGLERDPEQDPAPDMMFNQGYSGLQVLIATNRKARVLEALQDQPEEIEQIINYQTPKSEKSALHYAVEAGWGADIKKLTDAGAALELQDKDGRTPLHCAVLKKDLGAVEALLAAVDERLEALLRVELLRDLQHVARAVLEPPVGDLGVRLLVVRDDAVDERPHRPMVREEVALLLDVVLRLVVHVADAEDRRLARGGPAIVCEQTGEGDPRHEQGGLHD